MTAAIDRGRALLGRLPSRPVVERYWLGVGDATTLVVVRTFYGLSLIHI